MIDRRLCLILGASALSQQADAQEPGPEVGESAPEIQRSEGVVAPVPVGPAAPAAIQ